MGIPNWQGYYCDMHRDSVHIITKMTLTMGSLCPRLLSKNFQGPRCKADIQPIYTCTGVSFSCFGPGYLLIGPCPCCANSGWSGPCFAQGWVIPTGSTTLQCHHSSTWNPSHCVQLPQSRDLPMVPGATRNGRQW